MEVHESIVIHEGFLPKEFSELGDIDSDRVNGICKETGNTREHDLIAGWKWSGS